MTASQWQALHQPQVGNGDDEEPAAHQRRQHHHAIHPQRQPGRRKNCFGTESHRPCCRRHWCGGGRLESAGTIVGSLHQGFLLRRRPRCFGTVSPHRPCLRRPRCGDGRLGSAGTVVGSLQCYLLQLNKQGAWGPERDKANPNTPLLLGALEAMWCSEGSPQASID